MLYNVTFPGKLVKDVVSEQNKCRIVWAIIGGYCHNCSKPESSIAFRWRSFICFLASGHIHENGTCNACFLLLPAS